LGPKLPLENHVTPTGYPLLQYITANDRISVNTLTVLAIGLGNCYLPRNFPLKTEICYLIILIAWCP